VERRKNIHRAQKPAIPSGLANPSRFNYQQRPAKVRPAAPGPATTDSSIPNFVQEKNVKVNLHTIAAVAFVAGVTTPAFGYIDPGSGSAIMSAIIGFFVALGLAVKTYWYKLKALFGGGNANKQAAEADALEQDDS